MITNQLLQKGVQEKALLTNALYFLQAIRKCPFTQQVLCRNTLESHLLPVNSLRMEFLFNNPFYERNMVDKMAPFGITEIPYFDFYHHYQLFELLIWDPISKGQSLSTLFPLISTFITANPIVIFTKCSPIQSEFSLLEFIVLTAPDSAVFNNKIIATVRNAMKILGDQFTLEEYQTLSNALNAAVLVQRNAILPDLLNLISPLCSPVLPNSRSPFELFLYAKTFPTRAFDHNSFELKNEKYLHETFEESIADRYFAELLKAHSNLGHLNRVSPLFVALLANNFEALSLLRSSGFALVSEQVN